MIFNTVKYFSSRSIAGISYLLCTIIMLNSYSQEEYGLYSVSLSSAQTIALFSAVWVGVSANLLLPGLNGARLILKTGVLSLFSIIFCIISCIILLLAVSISIIPIPVSFIAPALIFCFAFGLNENQMYILNSRGQANAYALSIILRYVLGLIGVWLAVNFTINGRQNALLALSAGSLVALALPVVARQLRAAFTVDLKLLRVYLQPVVIVGVSSMIVAGLWTFSTYACRLSLYRAGNESELGLYAAVTDLANGPIALLFQAINLTWAPAVARAFSNGDHEAFKDYSSHYISATLLIALPGLLALGLTGPGLLSILSGDQLKSVSHALVVFIASTTMLSSIFGVAGLVLLVTGHKRVAVMLTLIVLIVNIAMLILFGGDAHRTALITALTLAVGAVISVLLIAENIDLSIVRRHFFHSLLASMLIGGLVYIFGYRDFVENPIISLSLSIFVVLFSYISLNSLGFRYQIKEYFST